MSDTPRVDEHKHNSSNYHKDSMVCNVAFAKQLEKENNRLLDIMAARPLMERALEALHKSCTYCENESLTGRCGACKHGIVIKDIEKHLKGGNP